MGVHIEPFKANDSNIEGLKVISAKTATDDRGTVRELFRGSVYSEVLPSPFCCRNLERPALKQIDNE